MILYQCLRCIRSERLEEILLLEEPPWRMLGGEQRSSETNLSEINELKMILVTLSHSRP